jgi:hypothetical protein
VVAGSAAGRAAIADLGVEADVVSISLPRQPAHRTCFSDFRWCATTGLDDGRFACMAAAQIPLLSNMSLAATWP